MYAQQLVDEYRALRVSPHRVFAQSFNRGDVLYWVANAPAFGKQAVYLDDRVDVPGGYDLAVASLPEIAARGVKIVAPPMWALVELDAANRIEPSAYALAAKAAGLDIITWTLERSGPLHMGGGYYFQSISAAIDNDGDTFTCSTCSRRTSRCGVSSRTGPLPLRITPIVRVFKLETPARKRRADRERGLPRARSIIPRLARAARLAGSRFVQFCRA